MKVHITLLFLDKYCIGKGYVQLNPASKSPFMLLPLKPILKVPFLEVLVLALAVFTKRFLE